MKAVSPKLEQQFFRQLNAVVEPAVRRGIGSPRLLPAGLILLESTGFISGELRSTPLLSFRAGRYRIVSTVRGQRSFWVKNLLKQPDVSYFLAGRRRNATAVVLRDGESSVDVATLPFFLRRLIAWLSIFARNGLAIVILTPVDG
ncbi:hypothetical protein A3709_08270 [Halioglobus sp. HI00S01]|uniref:nitroreductase/quinone reductase family protein n=1 Tax=Halioglobus sp. HI00S01 TaxID=1822214 RepID=UPI0007C2C4C1|nr:nitroreductase/quinone reductase family protein [Halioglobus sp. HI00S01]KZX54989.1 hypothetical protein A3709_08270 [Halioglobus sp. HI00S01]